MSETVEPTIVLIGCTKTKRIEAAPARDLYDVSDLFRRRRAYAEQLGFPWAVLSARHGVVDPDRVVEPYDFSMADCRCRFDMWAWSSGAIRCCAALVDVQLGVSPRLTIEIHAGREYVDPIWAASFRYEGTFVDVIAPLEGLGIGQQKRWYSQPSLFAGVAS